VSLLFILSRRKLRAGRRSDAPVPVRLGQHLWSGGIVAESLQPPPVLRGQAGGCLDCPGCLAELLLDLIQIDERAADFLRHRGICLEEVGALRSHPLEDWPEHFEVPRQPATRRPEHPHPVLLAPAPLAVKLAELAFFPRYDDPDRTPTFLRVAYQLPDVAFADHRLVLVVHKNARLQRSAAGIAVRQYEIAILGELLAHADSCPSSGLFGEVDLFPLADASDLRQLGFQLLVFLLELCHLSQAIFDSVSDGIPFGLGGAQFVLVPLSDLGGSFRQFRLESSPRALVLMIVFALQQTERLLGAELRDSCEVLRAEPVQNLSAGEFARARAQRALDGFCRHPHTVRSGRKNRPGPEEIFGNGTRFSGRFSQSLRTVQVGDGD